jgi:mannose-6-phosphate isomerase-like protein (cupin superfamily)
MKDDFSMKKFEQLPILDMPGQSRLHVIGSAVDAEHIAMSMAVMKPGEKILKHTHKKAEEIYILVKGRSTITGGNKPMKVKAPMFFRFPAKTPRAIINDSDEDAEWIFIGAPIDEYLEEDTYRPPKMKKK